MPIAATVLSHSPDSNRSELRFEVLRVLYPKAWIALVYWGLSLLLLIPWRAPLCCVFRRPISVPAWSPQQVRDWFSMILIDCIDWYWFLRRCTISKTTVVIIFVCILSALCCLHMSNTISKIPNNQDFTSDVSSLILSEIWMQFFLILILITSNSSNYMNWKTDQL